MRLTGTGLSLCLALPLLAGCVDEPDREAKRSTAIVTAPLDASLAAAGDRTLTLTTSAPKSLVLQANAPFVVCLPEPMTPRRMPLAQVYCRNDRPQCTALVSASEAELTLILPQLDPDEPLRLAEDAVGCRSNR